MNTLSKFIKNSEHGSLYQQLLNNAPKTPQQKIADLQPAEPELQRDNSELPLAERNVNMSNQLTRAAHKMGLPQKRIIALAIAKNDSRYSDHIVRNRQAAWTIRITAKDYAETYGVAMDQAYEQLQAGVDALVETSWEIIEQRHRRTTRTKGSWMHKATYHDGKGMIDIVFHPEIAPHILCLQAEFTTYKLKQAAALRSIYSWRLFECLMSWQSTGKWIVRVEEFKTIMQVPETYLKDFGQIRKSIIEPAVKELREKQNWIVEWRGYKEGRQVAELEFSFRPNPQEQLPL